MGKWIVRIDDTYCEYEFELKGGDNNSIQSLIDVICKKCGMKEIKCTRTRGYQDQRD